MSLIWWSLIDVFPCLRDPAFADVCKSRRYGGSTTTGEQMRVQKIFNQTGDCLKCSQRVIGTTYLSLGLLTLNGILEERSRS